MPKPTRAKLSASWSTLAAAATTGITGLGGELLASGAGAQPAQPAAEGGDFVLRKMLSRHYVSNVGYVLKIGDDCTGSDKFIEVLGCSFGPTFDHCRSPKL